MSRGEQTKRIIWAIALAAVGLGIWNEYSGAAANPDPEARCESTVYRMWNALGTELGCKAGFAARRLRGY